MLIALRRSRDEKNDETDYKMLQETLTVKDEEPLNSARYVRKVMQDIANVGHFMKHMGWNWTERVITIGASDKFRLALYEIRTLNGLDDGVAASFQRSRIHKPHAHTQAFKVNHSTSR
ncbi:hypothetical protein Tco_0162857 [Tanacetum coccineum]